MCKFDTESRPPTARLCIDGVGVFRGCSRGWQGHGLRDDGAPVKKTPQSATRKEERIGLGERAFERGERVIERETWTKWD